jgi:hypothetical protein
MNDSAKMLDELAVNFRVNRVQDAARIHAHFTAHLSRNRRGTTSQEEQQQELAIEIAEQKRGYEGSFRHGCHLGRLKVRCLEGKPGIVPSP